MAAAAATAAEYEVFHAKGDALRHLASMSNNYDWVTCHVGNYTLKLAVPGNARMARNDIGNELPTFDVVAGVPAGWPVNGAIAVNSQNLPSVDPSLQWKVLEEDKTRQLLEAVCGVPTGEDVAGRGRA